MKFALFISIIFAISSCYPKRFVSISKKIEKNCSSLKGKWRGTTFHDLRTELYNQGKLNFINWNNDTVFILESYELQSGTYNGRIWNKADTISYTYYKNTFSFDPQQLFTDYTIHLVQDWDTTSIRTEENANAIHTPEQNIYATRVLITPSNTRIECIRFKAFFKLERDR